jgi:hypothetical protein
MGAKFKYQTKRPEDLNRLATGCERLHRKYMFV